MRRRTGCTSQSATPVTSQLDSDSFIGKMDLTMWKQVGSSVFYGITSILIVFVNKTVLTRYEFPSFQVVGIGQMVATIMVTQILRIIGLVEFKKFELNRIKQVFPLPLLYLANLILGLGSTQKLNIPMFTVLRRFTLLFVSIGQIILLKKYESCKVYFTLSMMMFGAFVAAIGDWSFDLTAYTFILLNDFFTATNNIYMKKKSLEMDQLELMFYNASIVLLPAVGLAFFTGDIQEAYDYTEWYNPGFLLSFILACIMGFILMYSQLLCAKLTSALTLVVVGSLKNILVTYLGMFVGGDYFFSPLNFIGINISVIASLSFSFLKYREQSNSRRQETVKPVLQSSDTARTTLPV